MNILFTIDPHYICGRHCPLRTVNALNRNLSPDDAASTLPTGCRPRVNSCLAIAATCLALASTCVSSVAVRPSMSMCLTKPRLTFRQVSQGRQVSDQSPSTFQRPARQTIVCQMVCRRIPQLSLFFHGTNHVFGFLSDSPRSRVFTEIWFAECIVALRSGGEDGGDVDVDDRPLELLSLLDDADRARVSLSTSSRLTFSCE